jgi:hypothetical protein
VGPISYKNDPPLRVWQGQRQGRLGGRMVQLCSCYILHQTVTVANAVDVGKGQGQGSLSC